MSPDTAPPAVFAELARWWGGVNMLMASSLADQWAAGSPTRPDYIVTDFITFAGIDVADAFGIPYGIFSFGSAASTADMLGVHYGQAAWIPLIDPAVQQSYPMTWASRVGFGLAKPLLSRAAGAYVGRYGRNPVRAKLGLAPVTLWAEAVPLKDGAQPLVIVSRFPGLDMAIPLPPNWVCTGSLSTSKATPPQLDPTTAAWFDKFRGGVVVVAFGRLTVLSPKTITTIVEAARILRTDGIGVYWGLRDKSPLPADELLPDNLRVEEWIQQPSALGAFP